MKSNIYVGFFLVSLFSNNLLQLKRSQFLCKFKTVISYSFSLQRCYKISMGKCCKRHLPNGRESLKFDKFDVKH